MKAAGPVFTVRGRPDPALDNHTSPFEWAGLLSRVPDGHVVMCQPQDDRRTPFGGLSAEALKLKRVRGCIVDDGCRDIRAAVDQGFPVFASYAAPIDIVCAKRAQAFKQPVASRSQAARRRRRGADGAAQTARRRRRGAGASTRPAHERQPGPSWWRRWGRTTSAPRVAARCTVLLRENCALRARARCGARFPFAAAGRAAPEPWFGAAGTAPPAGAGGCAWHRRAGVRWRWHSVH